ncbi:S9 family peptidase [Pyxidicoccus parkwayensis]|uniref:S9 family peptidase n=1 Tax=Pyxidicoccus parkwayensis TaxID=2813578 RepID=A0ABX7NQB8_9BACT|nr:S9 family peptidase [Pyxidicoccus parkwaysis]QSQ21042.1 S9 family peptidase [Pyxidicoccus parkwaysis]
MRRVARIFGLGAVLLGSGPVLAQQQQADAGVESRRAEVALQGAVAKALRPSLDSVHEALQRTVRFRQVALSPNGRRVAWVESGTEAAGANPGGSVIQVLDLTESDAKPVRVTVCLGLRSCNESSVTWSPDGRRLAFLSDAGLGGTAQLYVASVSDGPVRKLTSFSVPVASPRWSPDGDSIGLLVMEGEGAEHAKGPTGPQARETGVVQEAHPVRRVAVVSVDDGGLRSVTPENLFVYEYAWSPDSDQLAVTAAPPPGDANWWVAKLYVVEVKSARARLLYTPKWQMTEPTWSPDGKQLAFIEGLMSDQGSNGGDVYVVPVAGGKARNLTPGMKATATSLDWMKQGQVTFGAQVMGDSALASVDPVKGGVTIRWRGPERVSAGGVVGASLADDGETSAVVRESFTRAPDVWVGPVGEWKPVTKHNADVKLPVGVVRSVTWQSEGREVQGWLLAPPTPPVGSAKAPMVTVIHGGPASAVVSSFNSQALMLTSQGYYVFFPNPRGSFGQGEEFVQANRRDFGYGDMRDIMSGVDAVLASEPVDAARLGVTGWSYGGYMTMWAVTQTQRFRAAVAGAGISNWQSYYGTNHIDTWMLPYFGASVYDEPDVYARSSPINFVKLVRTPTLLQHGERDVEVPASQSYEFFKALKSLGVETQLVIYEDEGHGLRKPEHGKDRTKRMVEWFDAHLPPPNIPGAKVSVPMR